MPKPYKLIPYKDLHNLHKLWVMGVPLRRIYKEHHYDVSLPTLAKLIKTYDALLVIKLTMLYDYEAKKQREINYYTVNGSLFPAWLGPRKTTQPDNYKYTGKWPTGKWETK